MSEWLGEVGQHYAAVITFKGYIWRPSWGNVPKLYLLEDEKKNIITIRSTAKFKIGDKWILDGTVKQQNKFRGQKQTHISGWSLMLRGKTK